jgi:type VI secretion system protein ImpJ
MASQQRVVWYEGMTLDPHHFQQWDRYQKGMLNARFRALNPFDWGLTALEIDRESLANGEVRVTDARGVMRDGLPFDTPEQDPPPPPRAVGEYFLPTEEKLAVYLALPLERSDGVNCQLGEGGTGRPVRYVSSTISALDDNTGAQERQITVSRPNLSILFGKEALEDYATIRIAELVHTTEGRYALSPRFVPPCLSIAASTTLMAMAKRLIEILAAKSASLSERRRRQPSGQIDYTASEVMVLGLLQTVNSFTPLLSHEYFVVKGHPESLYAALSSLAGALHTFSGDTTARPADLPNYDHNNLADCFGAIEARIVSLLEGVISQNFVQIRLDRQSDTRWVGRVPEEDLLKSAQFYLSVHGDIPERKVVDEFPMKIKIAAPEEVDALVSAALQGLPLTYAVRPPAGLPSRPGLQYFRLEKTGRFWDTIRKSAALTFFVPGEFRGLQLELFAVKEN